jgi:hypothetical protein
VGSQGGESGSPSLTLADVCTVAGFLGPCCQDALANVCVALPFDLRHGGLHSTSSTCLAWPMGCRWGDWEASPARSWLVAWGLLA